MGDSSFILHPSSLVRVRIAIQGAVQGVGFRPFVYRLATSLGLAGWVTNTPHGVLVEAEGPEAAVQRFLVRLPAERPPRSFIQSFEPTFLDAAGFTGFAIRASLESGTPSALVLPDIATCDDCLHELFDRANRRYRYPFTNCTNCGPRFSIIEALPYDRPKTTMRRFVMCEECQGEYDDPADRRFHAQPNACPRCGPRLALWDACGTVLHEGDEALRAAADSIRNGRVVALKGIGGFQLLADARSEEAVLALRQRKAREEKPFALMYPSLAAAGNDCVISPLEERLLASPEAPIVLLKKRAGVPVAPNVAPGVPELGVMLPYSPLHHLLLGDLASPVVATSGNLSDEPICTREHDAVERLKGVADVFLVHDRPIARHVDDSIARVVLGREMVLRRARGYAPLPVYYGAGDDAGEVLAVGAHLKNTIAMTKGARVFVSQHVGDLETEQAYKAFRQVIDDFACLYASTPAVVACDAHPNYLSTTYARESGHPVVAVQHHEAHVLACIAENELRGRVLGVSWDGTGFGPDNTIWGGEFLLVNVTDEGYERAATFRTFPLPGGDQAVREPRRSALGLLFEAFGEGILSWSHVPSVAGFESADLAVLGTLLVRRLNAPRTSSVGRLFDAIASIAGLQQRVRFEGQAAMALQFAADESVDEAYDCLIPAPGPRPVPSPTSGPPDSRTSGLSGSRAAGRPDLRTPGPLIIDWSPMLGQVLADMQSGVPVGRISARFHNALVNAIVAVARSVGEEQVALAGGCFQNALLLERAVHRLRADGFRVYWPQRIPTNDGGISLGQVVGARRRMKHVGLGTSDSERQAR